MVVIRLSRAGTKKKPFYHLAVTDKRSPRDGRFIERVGFYNPVARGKSEPMRVDLARIDHWLSVGAQLSPKVKSLVAKARKYQAFPPESLVEESAKSLDAEETETKVSASEEEITESDTEVVDSDGESSAVQEESTDPEVSAVDVEETVAEAADDSDAEEHIVGEDASEEEITKLSVESEKADDEDSETLAESSDSEINAEPDEVEPAEETAVEESDVPDTGVSTDDTEAAKASDKLS